MHLLIGNTVMIPATPARNSVVRVFNRGEHIDIKNIETLFGPQPAGKNGHLSSESHISPLTLEQAKYALIEISKQYAVQKASLESIHFLVAGPTADGSILHVSWGMGRKQYMSQLQQVSLPYGTEIFGLIEE